MGRTNIGFCGVLPRGPLECGLWMCVCLCVCGGEGGGGGGSRREGGGNHVQERLVHTLEVLPAGRVLRPQLYRHLGSRDTAARVSKWHVHTPQGACARLHVRTLVATCVPADVPKHQYYLPQTLTKTKRQAVHPSASRTRGSTWQPSYFGVRQRHTNYSQDKYFVPFYTVCGPADQLQRGRQQGPAKRHPPAACPYAREPAPRPIFAGSPGLEGIMASGRGRRSCSVGYYLRQCRWSVRYQGLTTILVYSSYRIVLYAVQYTAQHSTTLDNNALHGRDQHCVAESTRQLGLYKGWAGGAREVPPGGVPGSAGQRSRRWCGGLRPRSYRPPRRRRPPPRSPPATTRPESSPGRAVCPPALRCPLLSPRAVWDDRISPVQSEPLLRCIVNRDGTAVQKRMELHMIG